MSPAVAAPAATPTAPAIAPLDLDEAMGRYKLSLVAMTDAQLTEERHRLEAQPPYGQAHRAANDEFDRRLAIAHDIETAHAALVAAMAPTRQSCTIGCDGCGGKLDWEFWSDGTINLCSGCKPVPDEQVTR